MGTEDSWATSVASDSRLNKMTVIPNTGAYLAGLDKTQHKLLVCTSTGSGLTADHVYLCTEDGTSLIDITSTQIHTHADDSTGGIFIDILRANPTFIDTGAYFMLNQDKARWVNTVTSTGSVNNDTDGTTGELSIKLATGATSGSGSTISMKGMKLGFGDTSMFQSKVRIGTTTSIALHSGVNADDVTAADTNTRKYNAEICTTTNNNWFLRSADGSSNSTSDTGQAMTTARTAIKIVHLPQLGTPEVDLYLDDGTTSTTFQKTTNIPTSNTTDVANLMKHSLKNSTAADRTYFIYANRLAYYINDTWI